MRYFCSPRSLTPRVPSRRRSTSLLSGNYGPEIYESRLLLTATVSTVAESSAVPLPAQQTPGNYSGFWSIDGEGTHALVILQTGNAVSGEEMESSFSIGTITGKVRVNKLKAKIVGFDFTRTYKVKLTDEEHFAGTRRSILEGQKQKKESISATKVA